LTVPAEVVLMISVWVLQVTLLD